MWGLIVTHIIFYSSFECKFQNANEYAMVFVRGQALVWLVVQCFGASGNSNRPLKETVILKIILWCSAMDRHLLMDWYSSWLQTESHRRKNLLYSMFCGDHESWCPTWCLTEDSSAAHYTRQPLTGCCSSPRDCRFCGHHQLWWTEPLAVN